MYPFDVDLCGLVYESCLHVLTPRENQQRKAKLLLLIQEGQDYLFFLICLIFLTFNSF